MALLGIAGCILAIGWADYVTGTRMSFVIFYIVPIALAVTWLGRFAGVIAAIAAMIIRFVADTTGDASTLQQTWLWWNAAGGLLVFFLVVWMLGALIKFHRELEQRVQERTHDLEQEIEKRRQVQRELLELSANERSAMGRELHDQLGQHLVGTAMAAQVLADRLMARDETGAGEARQIAGLIEQGIAQTRQLARGLLLSDIEPDRLASELEEMCAAVRQQFPRVECLAQVGSTASLEDGTTAAQIYRIAQEALRNALRHSGASCVWLRVSEAKERNVLEIVVEDNGRGLPPESERRGMGLRIMQHRAEHLGSRLELTSRPDGGTRVACAVPLPAEKIQP